MNWNPQQGYPQQQPGYGPQPQQGGGMDFSGAPEQQSVGDLIPAKTPVICHWSLRWGNAAMGQAETQSQSSDGAYLDYELTVTEGPYARRKIWTKIGVAGSEKYVNWGRSTIRAILEAARGAGPQSPSGYRLGSYGELDNFIAPVRVKIEKGQQGYEDKNNVDCVLTPVSTDPKIQADLEALRSGAAYQQPAQVTLPMGGQQGAPQWAQGTQAAPQPQQGQAWSNPTQAQQPPAQAQPQPQPAQPQPDPTQRPAWMGNQAPPQQPPQQTEQAPQGNDPNTGEIPF